jgi:4-amino-4-deoxy-L-arabinose transferase-like glycosyltransferase
MIYSDDYKTGYTAPSEVPILYYFNALLYHITGPHEIVFRIVNLLLFFLGLFFLFKLAFRILKDVFFSALVVIFMFSSPVLIYYGNNFLPNTTALSFTFIGWYFFYDYYEKGKTGAFVKAILFFALACMMKVTEFASVTIILMMFLAERFRIMSFQVVKEKHRNLKLILLLSIYVLNAGWLVYAKYYNQLHGSWQFLTNTIPIWDMDMASIRFNLHKMHDIWFPEYFYPATFYLMLAGIVLMFLFYKRSHPVLRFTSACLLAEWAVYSLLFFERLGDHDYFYISFYILPALVFINLFYLFKQWTLPAWALRGAQVALVAFAVLNIIYGGKRHELRYEVDWMNDYNKNLGLYHINPWLSEHGITVKDSIIFYPGNYVRPLYLMNLKGWVINDEYHPDPEVMVKDSIALQKAVKNGAHYFITNRLDSALNYKPFQPYMNDLYGNFEDVFIFRISAETTTPVDGVTGSTRTSYSP